MIPDYSDRIGLFVGKSVVSLDKTINVQGMMFLQISSIDNSSRTVSGRVWWSKWLHSKGSFVGTIDEEYRLELVGIVSSLQTGSFDWRLNCYFSDLDLVKGKYVLDPRTWNFLNVKQNGECVLARQQQDQNKG